MSAGTIGMTRSAIAALLLLTLSTSIGFSFNTPQAYALTAAWTSPTQFSTNTGYDFQPEIIQTQDGTVWVFYEYAAISSPGTPDIFYKTYSWANWTAGNLKSATEKTLVASTSQDIAPSAAQLSNGTLYVSFGNDRAGNFDIYLKKYNPSTGWSPDYQVTSNTADEKVSGLVAASDGTLWVFWDRQFPTYSNIYYKTYKNGAWSNEAALTNDVAPIENSQPNAYQMKDGKIWVTWSSVRDSHFNKVLIYYATWNGSAWSTLTQQTNTNYADTGPSIVQDANLTVWMIWSRQLPATCTGGGCYQKDIFYSYSINNGASWSPDAQITNDQYCSYDNQIPNCYDDIQPSVKVLRDFRLWVFWASTRDPSGYWGIYYASSSAFPTHDLAVTNITVTPLLLRENSPVQITVTMVNLGGYTETFKVNIVATNTSTITILSKTYNSIPAGTTLSLTVKWNTTATSVPPDRYKVSATIPPVFGELPLNQANNSMTGGTVHLVPAGDVNRDGKVDIYDASVLAYAFGTKPGDAKWNPNADLNGSNKVDILDAAILAFTFGQTG